MPSVPPAATSPAANPGEWPRLRISGMPELPIAEEVARLDPAIAANRPQASTTATPRPPGPRCIQTCSRSCSVNKVMPAAIAL